MKHLLPYLLVISLVFAACFKTENVIANSAIDTKIRSEIKQKNDSVILGIRTGSKRIWRNIATEDFLKRVRAQTSAASRIFYYGNSGTNYTMYDEYIVKGKKEQEMTEIHNEEKGYTFNYAAPTETSCVSIMEFNAGDDKAGIAAIYAYEKNQWKLDRIDVFVISVAGKTPVDLYSIAKEAEANGKLYEASFYAENAADLLELFEESKFKYDAEKSIKLYKNTIAGKLDKLPHVLKDIKNEPMITKIDVRPDHDGSFSYTITYKTFTPVVNRDALEEEFKQIEPAAKEFLKDNINFEKSTYEFKAVNANDDGHIFNSHTF
jgi:hypothetical protein